MINRRDYYKHDTEYKIKVDMVEESKNFFKKTVKKIAWKGLLFFN